VQSNDIDFRITTKKGGNFILRDIVVQKKELKKLSSFKKK
jgi:hypothetical protein